MAKAGWCMDAVQYLHLDMEGYAAELHRKCKGKQCDCDCGHKERRTEDDERGDDRRDDGGGIPDPN